DVVNSWCQPEADPEDWDREALTVARREFFPLRSSVADIEDVHEAAELQDRFVQEAFEAYDAKEAARTPEVMRELERVVLLNITDTKWREHLYEMDYLQEGIHLRAYGQKDPLVEYQREAYTMFNELTESIRKDFVRYIYRVEFVQQNQPARAQRTQENRA